MTIHGYPITGGQHDDLERDGFIVTLRCHALKIGAQTWVASSAFGVYPVGEHLACVLEWEYVALILAGGACS